MDAIKKAVFIVLAVLMFFSTAIFSMYIIVNALELVIDKSLSHDKDWVYRNSPLITIPLWLAHSIVGDKPFLYIFTRYLLASLWFACWLSIVFGIYILLESGSNKVFAVELIVLGAVLAYAFDKLTKRLDSKIPNKQINQDK